MARIAIFAGHGGSDPGALGNGLRESDLNLAISNAVSGILRGWGYDVINNRTTDVNRSITQDANLANSSNVAAMVEIHFNSNPGTPGTGSEAFVSLNDTGAARRLAESILAGLAGLGFRNRGVKTQANAAGQDAFGILRLTNPPAVLLEVAFINNPTDMARLDINTAARAIAQGIRNTIPISGGGGGSGGGGTDFPGTIRIGDRGENVRRIQQCINAANTRNPAIPRLNEDGVFGPLTQASVIAFQRAFNLTTDGIVGPITWGRLMQECSPANTFPGTIRIGDRGENVRRIQQCINTVANHNNTIPRLNEDGIFGPLTQASVIAFQRAFGLTTDGIVGPITWGRLMQECNIRNCTNNDPTPPANHLPGMIMALMLINNLR